MIIGLLRLTLHLPACGSLKEKRRVLSILKARLARSFNVSVAEVDAQEMWQKTVLAVAHIGVSRPVVDSVLARAVDVVEGYHAAQLIDYETELIT
ncbi:MAG: DUF503 domain-containing protein [Deltaproteobacteria bacterium]